MRLLTFTGHWVVDGIRKLKYRKILSGQNGMVCSFKLGVQHQQGQSFAYSTCTNNRFLFEELLALDRVAGGF